jgi:RimJ/RimL family protein N-acetyltransferase
MTQPTLETERLILRPLRAEDAADVQRLAGAYEVALNTFLIPHPYPDGVAEEWIAGLEKQFEEGQQLALAITIRDSGELAGVIGLRFRPKHDNAELGYWVGIPYWNRGYTTEAARAMLRWGFEERGFRRIFGRHFARNPASGRVLEKAGMTYEGTLRAHTKKWGEYQDLLMYGILREEAQHAGTGPAIPR